MSDKIFKFLKFICPAAMFCLALFIFFSMAHAQDSLGNDWYKFLETRIPSFTGPVGSTGQDLAMIAIRRAISIVEYMVGGAALIMGLIYAINFVLARGKEETISKYRTNFLWLFIGFVIIMAAQSIADIFNPVAAKSTALIDFTKASDKLREITNYVKWLIGSVIVLFTTVSGVRLVVARGNEEKISKEKDNLIYSGIGMLILLMASNIVDAIYVINDPDHIVSGGSVRIVNELGSIIRLLLVFLGPVTILFTLGAGFMYMSAFENEERAKTARNMIVAGITGIVIVYISYALVATFMTAPLVPSAQVPNT